MQIGIFARTFSHPTLGEILATIKRYELDCVQFNFSCVGLPTLPESIDDSLAEFIKRDFANHKLGLAAVSGTFNMIHPDAGLRQDGIRKFTVLLDACARLGAPIVSVCTGTRDPNDMWRRHPGNDRADAMADLRSTLSQVLETAEARGVTLGVEPETNNVVSSAGKARQLLDELRSPRLKIIIDPANLFTLQDIPRMREILDEAFDLVGPDIVLAHAKDIQTEWGLHHVAAGKGLLDYGHYIELLKYCNRQIPLILHDLAEPDVAQSVAFLRQKNT